MLASAILATALASTTPQAAPSATVPVFAASAPSEPSAAKQPMAAGKMDCCKDGCECCGKDKAAKAEPEREHAH